MRKRRLAVLLPVLLVTGSVLAAGLPAVNQSARQIPVAYKVDVVVVGGSTGAVSAAACAARAGAKVFLAAPRPYLGDDMTATLRLWLEEGETPVAPLARRIFSDEVQLHDTADPNRIDFSYEANLPSARLHPDTKPPGLLSDCTWMDPIHQSVQYDGDVNVTVDLGKPQQLDKVRLMAFHREPSEERSGFKIQSVTIFTSDDKKTWKQVAIVKNEQTAKKTDGSAQDRSITLSAPVPEKTRYLKLEVKKSADVRRVLLGEIEVTKPGDPAAPKRTSGPPPPRPMHVKKTLDEVLLEAGVEFLYSCYATDVLRDAEGNPCGIVMANRAGRQAVVAKTIIDATDRAVVARLAGAEFRAFPGGVQTVKRVVIGGDVRTAKGLTAREILPPFRGRFPNPAKTSSGIFRIIEYTLQLPVAADTPAAWATADQRARTLTYHPEQQFTSDVLFQVPPDPIDGRQPAEGAWQGMDKLPLGAFRPKEVARLFVLGGCADISREQAAKLLRPLALIDLGTRLGVAAASEAKSVSAPEDVRVAGGASAGPATGGDVGEFLVGVRPTQKLPTVPEDARSLPVLGHYDVVVIGGGTAGAPAGIAAARQGAKTLVVEYLHGLGGVGTVGAISKYYWGNRVGFTLEIPGGASWVIEQKMEWYRQELLKAGADVWFGTLGCGALVEDGRVTGAVVATPQGRGVVLAKVVIDATGNADVAAAAGAECIYTDHTEFAMQGTGLPPRQLGATYTNTDFTITDETDMVDVWHMFLHAKEKYPRAFDQGQLIDTRERRRIVGDLTITVLDQVNCRTFPDSVVHARSNFDTHGYTIDPYLMLEHPERKGVYSYIPYRTMLPKGMRGILVVGLGLSAHRDAVPVIRMQPDIQNGGYAAGVAAAMAVEGGKELRKIDVRKLQKHLVEIGNLPESVLTDKDSYPMPPERIAAAVESVKNENAPGAAVILAHPEQALPLLKKAYQAAGGRDKLGYAKVLCMMGDAAGLETLMAEVDRIAEWDAGWDFKSGGQFGHAMSALDSLVVALGRTREQKAVPVILRKLKLLTPESKFSHHRAVALALELIGDSSAAEPLAGLLTQPGVAGYAHSSLEKTRLLDEGTKLGLGAVEPRRVSLRELMLARALYRCGDHNGLGEKILREYAKDLRGHLARHAQAVLDAGEE